MRGGDREHGTIWRLTTRWIANLRYAALVALLGLAATSIGLAQEMHFLELPSEGAASLVISRNTETAWLLDGGQPGIGGANGVTINGVDMLAYIRSLGIERIVVSCSHPHSDHLGGIKALASRVPGRPEAPSLGEFKDIHFIDSGYPAQQSLYALFLEHNPTLKSRTAQSTAANRDAFPQDSFVAPPPGAAPDARVGNFVYVPKSGAGAHGSAIITHTLLTSATTPETTLVVDFDDADTALVAEWASWAKEKLPQSTHRIYQPPHHNSDGTDISPLLTSALRPTAVVIAANSGNKFGHPGPRNWRKWADALGGAEHVHVTGAGTGIVVTASGLRPADNDERQQTFSRIVAPQIQRLERKLRVEEEAQGINFDVAALKSERKRARLTIPTFAKRMGVSALTAVAWEERLLPVPEVRRLDLFQLFRVDIPARRIQSIREELSAVRAIDAALRPEAQLQIARTPVAAIGGPAVSQSDKPNPSGATDSSIGPYQEKTKAFEDSHSGLSSSGPRGPDRVQRFDASTSGYPVFGGIVFGNKVSGGSLAPLESRVRANRDGDFELQIKIGTASDRDGSWFTYNDFTPMELWTAYHVAVPLENWKTDYGVSGHECNLVGMDTNKHGRWTFAVHPSLANTLIARDLMALDMLLSAKEKQLSLPEFQSYRWCDQPTEIHIRPDGAVEVLPSGGIGPAVLRFKLWANKEVLVQQSLVEGEIRRLDDEIRMLRYPAHEPLSAGAIPKVHGGISVLGNPFGSDMASDQKLRITQLENERVETAKELSELNRRLMIGGDVSFDDAAIVRSIYEQFPVVRRADRFARILALINWLADTNPAALPDLSPTRFVVGWLAVEPELSYEEASRLLSEDQPLFESRVTYSADLLRPTSMLSYWIVWGPIVILSVGLLRWLRRRNRPAHA